MLGEVVNVLSQTVSLLNYVVNVFLFLLLEQRLYIVLVSKTRYTNLIVSNCEVCLQNGFAYVVVLQVN